MKKTTLFLGILIGAILAVGVSIYAANNPDEEEGEVVSDVEQSTAAESDVDDEETTILLNDDPEDDSAQADADKFPNDVELVYNSSSTVRAGSKISYSWRVPTGHHIYRDRIGIYDINSNSDEPIRAVFASGKWGTKIVNAPREPGTYELRYLDYDSLDRRGGNYHEVARSESFTVIERETRRARSAAAARNNSDPIIVRPGQQIKTTWRTPASSSTSGDWLGLFATNASNDEYFNRMFVNEPNGTVIFEAPSEEGLYEIRYYKAEGTESVAESRTFRVKS